MVGQIPIENTVSREILTPGNGFIHSYDYTLNPYVGCTYACKYCSAAHLVAARSQQDFDNWGSWVRAKGNAVKLIQKIPNGTLNRKTIYASTATDPYQPAELKLRITRGILTDLHQRQRARVTIQTRSPLIVQDIDLIADMASRVPGTKVNMTIATDDEEVRRNFEPACPGMDARFRAVAKLASRGIPTLITITPMLVIRDADTFAAKLRDSGARAFVAQPFHISAEERDHFRSATRSDALERMDQLAGSQRQYQDMYRRTTDRLRELLHDFPFEEGQAGFTPQFGL